MFGFVLQNQLTNSSRSFSQEFNCQNRQYFTSKLIIILTDLYTDVNEKGFLNISYWKFYILNVTQRIHNKKTAGGICLESNRLRTRTKESRTKRNKTKMSSILRRNWLFVSMHCRTILQQFHRNIHLNWIELNYIIACALWCHTMWYDMMGYDVMLHDMT